MNHDQRLLLDMYISLYNHTTRQLEMLQNIQQGILEDIRRIVNIPESTSYASSTRARNNNTNNNSHQYMFDNILPLPNRTRNTGENRNDTYYDSRTRQFYIQGRPYRLDFLQHNGIPFYEQESTNQSRGQRTNNYMDNLWSQLEQFYANVVVRPTNREIQYATHNRIFSQIDNPLNSSCPISLEPFEQDSVVTQILGCGHLFNPENLANWFQRNVRCPVCRYDIRSPLLRSNLNNSNINSANNSYNENTNPVNTNTNADHVEGNNNPIQEETKEEGDPEESKEETDASFNDVERNRDPFINLNFRSFQDISNNDLLHNLSNLTEVILSQYLNTGNAPIQWNHNNTRVMYDASSNEIIFHGYYV